MVSKRTVILGVFSLSVAAAFVGTLWNLQGNTFQGQVVSGTSQVIDDGDAGFSTSGQGWQRFQHSLGYRGDIMAPSKVTDSSLAATWTFSNMAAGQYKFYVTFKAYSLLTNKAPYTIKDGSSTLGSTTVNQKTDPTGNLYDGKNWSLLGMYTVKGPTVSITLSRPQDLTVNGMIADSARIERVTAPAETFGLLPAAGLAEGQGGCRAGFTLVEGYNYPYITCLAFCGDDICNTAEYYQYSGSTACCKCGPSLWCASSSSRSSTPGATSSLSSTPGAASSRYSTPGATSSRPAQSSAMSKPSTGGSSAFASSLPDAEVLPPNQLQYPGQQCPPGTIPDCPTPNYCECKPFPCPPGTILDCNPSGCDCRPLSCPDGFYVDHNTGICMPVSVCGDGYVEPQGRPIELCETGTNEGCAPGRTCQGCTRCGLCGDTFIDRSETCEADYSCASGSACQDCQCTTSTTPLTANMTSALDSASPGFSTYTSPYNTTVLSWTLAIQPQSMYDVYVKLKRAYSDPCPIRSYWRVYDGSRQVHTLTINYGNYVCTTWPGTNVQGTQEAWVNIGSVVASSSSLRIEHAPPPPPEGQQPAITTFQPTAVRVVKQFNIVDPAPLGVTLIDNGDLGFRTLVGTWEERQFPMPDAWSIGPVTNPLFDDDIALQYINRGDPSPTSSWSFTVAPGSYRVLVTFAKLSPVNFVNKNAIYSVRNGNQAGPELGRVTVDHSYPPNGPMYRFVSWKDLGTYTVTGNRLSVVLTNPYGLSSDAVRIEKIGGASSSAQSSYWSSASSQGLTCSSLPWLQCASGFQCLAQCINGDCAGVDTLGCPPGTVSQRNGTCGNDLCHNECERCVPVASSSRSSASSQQWFGCSGSFKCNVAWANNQCARLSIDCSPGTQLVCDAPCGSASCGGECCRCASVASSRSSASSVVACANEGEVVSEGNMRPCCDSLKSIPFIQPDASNQCFNISLNSICTRCGNGQCGTGENFCNCTNDCPRPASSRSSAVSSASSTAWRVCDANLLCEVQWYQNQCNVLPIDCMPGANLVCDGGACGNNQCAGRCCRCVGGTSSRSSTSSAAAACGNYRLDPGEQCDGPNLPCQPGQVCTADCTCVPQPPNRIQWETVGDSYLVSTLSDYAIFGHGSYLYIVGGMGFWGPTRDELRSSDGLSWSRVASLPQSLSNTAYLQSDAAALLVGGLLNADSTVHWAFETPNLLTVGFQSNPDYGLSSPRYDGALLRVGDRTYFLGGYSKSSPLGGFLLSSLLGSLVSQTAISTPSKEIYLHVGTRWSRVQPDLPFAVSQDDAFTIGNRLFILDRSTPRKVYMSTTGTSWAQVATLPTETASTKFLKPIQHKGAIWFIAKSGPLAGSAVTTTNGQQWIVADGVFPSDLKEFEPEAAVSFKDEIWLLGSVRDYYVGGNSRNGKVLRTGASGGPFCGDGFVLSPEQCDDGNATPSDGCSNCQIDSGWICTGSPSRCTMIIGSSSSAQSCAQNGERVYVASQFGPTTCCSKNAGIKPNSYLAGEICVSTTDGAKGTCIDNWWQTCGDGICGADEDQCNCSADCPAATCGNGLCEEGEANSCPACVYQNPPCNAPCQSGTCPNDCPSVCGDGKCEENENAQNCFQDCCPAMLDCPAPPPGCVYVDPREDGKGCPISCGTLKCEDTCGNGRIDLGEECDSSAESFANQCGQREKCGKDCRCSGVICPVYSAPYCPNGVLVPQLGPDENGCSLPPVCCNGAKNLKAQCSLTLKCGGGSCVISSCTCK
ncbi:MAG: DUF4215 domain-containing protein [Candidatus Peregrinibacteria bacterium]